MACTDLGFSLRGSCSDRRNNERLSRRRKRTRKLLWTVRWVHEKSFKSPSKNGEFPLRTVKSGSPTLHQEFQEETTLLKVIRACSKQKNLFKGTCIHAIALERGYLKENVSIGNAILSMYVKCGAISKAQETFNQMSVRNVVTWNALIAACVQNGLHDEALSCFEQMQHAGFSPNAVTFICTMKACGAIGVVAKGEELHTEASKQGLMERDIMLGTACVDMYSKCGMPGKAHLLFDSLPLRNVITWNALIGGYVKHGLGKEALTCFEKMKDEDLAPDATTYIHILKACGSIGAAKKGEEIHAEISRQGHLGNNTVLGTALVDMYAKCGELGKAQAAFDKLSAWSVVTWNALIAGYAQHGLGNEAVSCYTQMRGEGLHPDSVTFISTLKACGSICAVEKGKEIHAEIDKQELLENDVVLGNALLDMYMKCGAFMKARAVFDELPRRNVVTWNAVIAGYAQLGHGVKALQWFDQMLRKGFSPNNVTFLCVLKACGSIGAAEKGAEIHAEISSRGLLTSDIVLGNALVDMYAKCGRLEKAQEVFDELPTRNVVTWNALLAGYTQHGLADEALSWFSRMMRDDAVFPDRVTFLCALKACSSLGAAEIGKEIHAVLDRQRLLVDGDIMLGNALVDMYGKCGMLTNAQELFDELPARDVAIWTSLIAGYAQHGHDDQALSIYTQMRDEGLSPNVVTFICTLKACGNIGAIDEGERIHAEVDSLGLMENNTMLGNALISMYAKCGAMAKSQQVFHKLPSQGVDTWTVLIAGYAQAGKFKMVFDLFIKMVKGGVEPNVVTFVVLLTACSHAGLVEEGQIYFDSMANIYSIIPTLEHHMCMVDVFSRAGCFNRAVSIIKKAPRSDYFLLWSALMGACRKWVNGELGRRAFELSVWLDETFAAAYI